MQKSIAWLVAGESLLSPSKLSHCSLDLELFVHCSHLLAAAPTQQAHTVSFSRFIFVFNSAFAEFLFYLEGVKMLERQIVIQTTIKQSNN